MLGIRRMIYGLIAHYVTKSRKQYHQRVANDMASLKGHLHKGDIILIDGDQRISEVIKYLSQSTWSHAAIYIGDELTRRDPRDRALLLGQYDEEANHLIIEALMEGVVASPIIKYESFNLRVCRPINIRPEDVDRIVNEVTSQLGYTYDVKHIVDLARYLFPVSLIPRRFRRNILKLGSGLTREVICSTMIARAFQNVGFPILPEVVPGDRVTPSRWRAFRDRLLRRRPVESGVFHKRSPALVTPSDFDLSPYFEILKINHAGHDTFDYRLINWADDSPPQDAVEEKTGTE